MNDAKTLFPSHQSSFEIRYTPMLVLLLSGIPAATINRIATRHDVSIIRLFISPP